MGRPHGWVVNFDSHPIAASMDNHTACIDVELENKDEPDYLSILQWILLMARKINNYCENNRVAGDNAAEYWMERFLWRSECVCKWDHLQ